MLKPTLLPLILVGFAVPAAVWAQKVPDTIDPVRQAGLGAVLDFDIRDRIPAAPDEVSPVAPGAAMTGPSRLTPRQVAGDFLKARIPRLVKGEADLGSFSVDAREESSGAWFLTYRQSVRGVPVFGGRLDVALDREGRIIHVSSGSVAPEAALRTTIPRLSARQAVAAAFRSLGAAAPSGLSSLPDNSAGAAFRNPLGDAFSPITAELSVFPIPPGSARLAWRISLDRGSEAWYEILLDAEDGALLFRHNTVLHASGRVWKESPLKGSREIVTFPPAWLPSGATATTGNNVDAYLDTDGDNQPDSTPAPGILNGRATNEAGVFDFAGAEGSTGANPRDHKAASVTSLFYFVNLAHDWFYTLGFTEASWNFQTDNFGKGGAASDAIKAEAQDGGATNNASFTPTRDGTQPRLQTGLFTLGTTAQSDDRDSAYDGTVVMHEVAHGLSTRLAGRGQDVSCLSGTQSGGMGEGWSDYFGASYFNNPVAGAYSSNNETRGFRRTSLEGTALNYSSLGNTGYEVHRDGELWAQTLWDLRSQLGAAITDRLVVDGLKLTPCNPSMPQARDAILAADLAANQGANRAKIWAVFAKRGMGASACGFDGTSSTGTIHAAASDLPADLGSGARPPAWRCPSAGPGIAALGVVFRHTIATTDNATGLRYEVLSGPPGTAVDANGVISYVATFYSNRVQIAVTNPAGVTALYTLRVAAETPLRSGDNLVLSGALGDSGIGSIDVPAGTTILQFSLSGGSGDADVVVIAPDNSLAGLSVQDGAEETVSIASPAAGRWRVFVLGYRAFAGVTLKAELLEPAVVPPGSSRTGLSGKRYSETFYRIPLSAAILAVTIRLSGGTGDADLYVTTGKPPTCSQVVNLRIGCFSDARSIAVGNSETLEITNRQAGDVYLLVRGYAEYSGVTLTTTARAAPTLLASSAERTFASLEAGAAPPSQTIVISDATGTAFPWTAAAETTSGGAWLRVTPTSGTGQATLTMSVDPARLAVGQYKGRVVVTAASLAGSPLSVNVTLNISARPVLAASPQRLSYAASPGQEAPAQTIALTYPSDWTATAQTANGGAWLTVDPARGTGSANVRVTARTGTLASGRYTGAVVVTATDASNSPLSIPVEFIVSPPLAIARDGILNGASLTYKPITSNQRLVILGSGLGDACEAETCPSARGSSLPLTLGSTRVTIDGVPCPLALVSPQQINLVTPELKGPTASIVVTRGGVSSTPYVMPVAAESVGVFTILGTGAGAGLIRHSDGTLVSRTSPLELKETVTILATGIKAPGAGMRVFFDGSEGRVLSSALSQDQGVYEVRVEVPEFLGRRFPLVSLAGTDQVSAGGPTLLDILPSTLRAGSTAAVLVRGINLPPTPVLRVNGTNLFAAIAGADGGYQLLIAAIPGNLLTGKLTIQVTDPAAPGEEPSTPVALTANP